MKKQSKKTQERLAEELAARLVEISIQAAESVPDKALASVASGKRMLVIWRTTEICQCCGKPVLRMCTANKTKRPLEEIFQP